MKEKKFELRGEIVFLREDVWCVAEKKEEEKEEEDEEKGM